MAEEGKADEQLFQLLSNLLHQSNGIGEDEGGLIINVANVEKRFDANVANGIGEDEGYIFNAVETLTNQEEVELRSKIEALGLEVTKVPSKSAQHLDELEIAKELDKLSTKLDDVDEMISSALAEDPKVQSLLSGTADVWMPVITATAEERLNFSAPTGDDCSEVGGKTSN